MKRPPLQALLLAAGLRTHLRAITLHTLRYMVWIGSERDLGRWLRKLDAVGCETVLGVTHYLAEQVRTFLKGWQSIGMAVDSVDEPEVLGTAVTIFPNQDIFRGATGLLTLPKRHG